MSEIDKALQAFTANQKMIERMTRDPFSPIVQQQKELLNAATASIRFSNAFSTQCTVPTGIFSGFNQYVKLSKAITSSIGVYNAVIQIINEMTSPVTNVCRDMSVFSQQEFQSAISPLLSSINNIHVFPDYVEAPEVLISDKLSKATPEVLSQSSSAKKKLTRSEVAWLVTFLLTLLSWLFPDPLSTLQENTDMETFSITQEHGEQIIECLISLTEYLENHPSQMNDATSSHPVPDLLPSDSQLDIATPDSAIQSNSEVDSKPDNTESSSKAE